MQEYARCHSGKRGFLCSLAVPALRWRVALARGTASGLAWAACAAVLASRAWATPLATTNIVLLTLDGVRIQELFYGMDAAIAASDEHSGIDDIDVVRQRYWRDTPQARREALMPNFWRNLAPLGIVLGDQARGSTVQVRNDQWFSYPGYSEILTGMPQPDVRSNDLVRYPHVTVLQYLGEALRAKPTDIAQIGSWDGFKMAASSVDDAFFMNGAYEPMPAALSTPEMDELVELRKQVMELWEEGSNDVLTTRLALAYLRRERPRVLWLGLSQSDDWAHARRYDRLLDYLHLADTLLAELWSTLQSIDQYRDKTTLIITTDHGRGRTPKDWTEHDAGIEGSQDIWIAIIGPDTPQVGELAPADTVHQSDIAATMLQLLGFDYRDYNPAAGPPIAAAFAKH
jgi:Type I phosphodiesterase / nucleotide pyrophosphatase